MKRTIKQNKLGAYLAVTAGVGCVASVAEGAVTFYGVNSANDANSDPVGIALGYFSSRQSLDRTFSYGSEFLNSGGVSLTNGTDLTGSSSGTIGTYTDINMDFANGAQSGDQNYANISFNGNDSVYEAVAQFFLDGQGGGYLIAIATTNPQPNPQDLSGVGGPALSISNGKGMIDAAAVPEPSSLALLALGATGLVTRLNRKKAA